MLFFPIFRQAASPLSWISRTRIATMPLRAKILSSAMSNSQRHSSMSEISEDDPDDVMFSSTSGVRTIELNRPKKLNSLNASMASKIIPRLQEWTKSQLANVVIIKGAGRAFCAGGDVAALAKWNQEGRDGKKRSADYFALEYQLDHLIATYTKPYLAFMDGITMGGGVGLSIHAPFRIATENTVFAMPETTIGFFPDVGASFFLPKMDGAMGMYLALTSEQLKGVDVFYHGVATHFIHSSTLVDLETRLGELQFKDYLTLEERHEIINSTIEEYVTGLPSDMPAISGKLRQAVDAVFTPQNFAGKDVRNTMTQMLAGLEAYREDSSPEISKWAENTIKTIKERSPTSVLVTLQQLQSSQNWSIAETFQHEHNIATEFMAHPDFVEGVSARLINRKKERPDWAPNTIEDADPSSISKFFQHRASLSLLNTGQNADYKQYPHAWIGLPTEAEMGGVLEEKLRAEPVKGDLQINAKIAEQVVNHFVQVQKGKQGVREKATEFVKRRLELM